MSPRLLLVSYHFPPSEAAGALRWQRLAPLAAARGWEIDVLSLARAQAESVDERRLAELPGTVHLHEVGTADPLPTVIEAAAWRVWRRVRSERSAAVQAARRRTFSNREAVRTLRLDGRSVVRSWNVLMARARELAWVRPAVRTGLELGSRHRPDLVLSCGPPHLVHEAGRRLARAFHVPFVMDMRDTWTVEANLPEALASPLWFRIGERDEARCVAEAKLVVMNTPLAAHAMRNKWPDRSVIAVMNGWDDEPLIQAPWPAQFRIVYAGSIYLDRTPQPLFRAVAATVRPLGLSPAQFEVRLIGSTDAVTGPMVSSFAQAEGISDYVRLLSRMPRSEVLREYAQAAILLSLPQGLHFAVPSKVFEYIRQPAWVVVQSDPRSATADLLRGTPAFIVDPSAVEETTNILVHCYREFVAGRRPPPIAQDGRWSRAGEAERLFSAMESLVRGTVVIRQQTPGAPILPLLPTHPPSK